MLDTAAVDLISDEGDFGTLEISRLPTSQEGVDRDGRDGLVVVREARSYRYRLSVPGPVAHLEPVELFDADDASRTTGRLIPGEAVGLINVEVLTEAGRVFRGRLDVRSAKFSDEQAFGLMLSDLAARSVEALHQGFAPSSGQFSSGAGASPRLLYQQFAVLTSLLNGSDLRWAINQVLGDPHQAWESEQEPRQPGRPLRGSSRLSTQLSCPGPRVETPRGPLKSLPAVLLVTRTEQTLDTVPNRFVRFALERWRALAFAVLTNAQALPGAAMRRGVGEAQRVLDELDEVLGHPLFRQIGRLTIFPGDNPVLRRREGYRQIFAASALIEGTLGLELDLEDPFLVSRRSIATLYEYWTFVCLADVVARVCGSSGRQGELFKEAASGMSLILKAGASTRMKFETVVGTERVLVDLFFNNEFRKGSWTRPMRPDASLLVRRPGDREVWLHFDAKYKVDWQQPFQTGDADEEEAAERTGASKRTDLLKMHAYRDAIRDSAGSYVLFPGSEAVGFQARAEFLPGLGAFPLRPDKSEEDSAALEVFMSRVLNHVAGAGTRHRRATFWESKAYTGGGTNASDALPPVGELPPADTAVLFGYVRSDAQWAWIRDMKLYNVRGGDRPGAMTAGDSELDAPLLLLYGRERGEETRELYERASAWEAVTAESLERLGYPNPRGSAYLVTTLEPVPAPNWLEAVDTQDLRPPRVLSGQPFSTSWLDVVLSTQDSSA
jgi:hypothetical protein